MSKRLYEDEDYTSTDRDLVKRRKEDYDEDKPFSFYDDIYVYNVGNEIHFSTGVNTESIQKLMKIIQKIIYIHTKKNKSEKLVITYTIDSPGGSISSVLKFYDFINCIKKKYKFIEFVSIITGMAASAGTIMALTADRRLMTKNAYAMVHELSTGNSGKFKYLRSYMEYIVKLHNRLVNIYVKTTQKTTEEIEKIMDQETWFSAEEYKKMGFIDDII